MLIPGGGKGVAAEAELALAMHSSKVSRATAALGPASNRYSLPERKRRWEEERRSPSLFADGCSRLAQRCRGLPGAGQYWRRE